MTLSPELVIAFATAAVILLMGAVKAGLAVWEVIKQTRRTVEVVAALNVQQDQKLVGIKEDTRTIVFVTDGNYTKLLEEIAGLRRLFAAETGRPADFDNAVHAQARANEHATLSADAKAAAATGVPTPTRTEDGE